MPLLAIQTPCPDTTASVRVPSPFPLPAPSVSEQGTPGLMLCSMPGAVSWLLWQFIGLYWHRATPCPAHACLTVALVLHADNPRSCRGLAPRWQASRAGASPSWNSAWFGGMGDRPVFRPALEGEARMTIRQGHQPRAGSARQPGPGALITTVPLSSVTTYPEQSRPLAVGIPTARGTSVSGWSGSVQPVVFLCHVRNPLIG